MLAANELIAAARSLHLAAAAERGEALSYAEKLETKLGLRMEAGEEIGCWRFISVQKGGRNLKLV
jgi:hypothetical protein